jgi:hypothetical protein
MSAALCRRLHLVVAQGSIVLLAIFHFSIPCLSDENLPLRGTGVVSRITAPEADVSVELSQKGRWLSVKKLGGSGGWGRLLREPEESVLLTNGLVIVLPGNLAFDLKDSNPRNVIRDDAPPTNSIWGTPVDGLAIGLRAGSDVLESGGSVRLEVYLRNTGDKPLRVPACPHCPERILLPHLKVIGPSGEVTTAARGKTLASTFTCCLYDHDREWPVLKPNQTLGPLRLNVLTADKSATIWDYWFDLSRPGEYQISLEYEGPADRHFDLSATPTTWQGLAWSGIVRVRIR